MASANRFYLGWFKLYLRWVGPKQCVCSTPCILSRQLDHVGFCDWSTRTPNTGLEVQEPPARKRTTSKLESYGLQHTGTVWAKQNWGWFSPISSCWGGNRGPEGSGVWTYKPFKVRGCFMPMSWSHKVPTQQKCSGVYCFCGHFKLQLVANI